MSPIEKDKDQQQSTKFSTFNHRECGTVVAVDITTRFLKEYLTARMYLENFPPVGNCDEEIQANQKIMKEKVKPFFDHLDEILDTL